MGCSLANVPCLVPAQLYRDCVALGRSVGWASLANSYECPRGAAPGDAWLVLSRAALALIDPSFAFAGDYDLTFTTDNVSGPQAPPVVIRNLVVVGAECLVPGAEGDDSPYLVRLADRRLLVNRRHADAAYNVRDRLSGELIDSSLDAGTPWTWQEVLGELWTAAGLGTAPALPATPDADPENLEYYQTPALQAIEHFLQRVGCVLVYDPIADAFSIADDGAADPAHDAAVDRWERFRVDDAYAAVPGRTARPGACRVLFARVPHVIGQGTPWHAVDVADPEGQGEPGTLAVIHDELAALVVGGLIDNDAELQARAEARAADYFAMLTSADRARLAWPLPLSEPGLRPGGRVESVRWSHQAGTGTRTQLRRPAVVERTRADPASIPPGSATADASRTVDGTITPAGAIDGAGRQILRGDKVLDGTLSILAGPNPAYSPDFLGTTPILRFVYDVSTSGTESQLGSYQAGARVDRIWDDGTDWNFDWGYAEGTGLRSQGFRLMTDATLGTRLRLYGVVGVLSQKPAYEIVSGSTTYTGFTGTGGGGDSYFGGICYAAGAGANLAVGTSTVSGGTAFGVLYADGGGVLRNAAPSGANQLLASGSLAWVSLNTTLGITAGVLGARVQKSVTFDASGLQLDGDSAAPGNNRVYGTDGAGAKGWQPLGLITVGTTVLSSSASFGVLYADGSGVLQNVAPSGANQLLASGSLGWVSLDSTLAITAGVLGVSTAPYTDEQAQDAVAAMLTDTQTVAWTYVDASNVMVANVQYQQSITSDGLGLKLTGDSASPGNNYVYGTSSAGAKGWQPLGAGTGVVPGWVKVTKTYLDLSAAATTNTINVYALATGQYVLAAVIKHSAAFSGGAISVYQVFCTTPGVTTGTLDAHAAPAASGYKSNAATLQFCAFSAQNVTLTANSAGANLSAATQGSVDVWLLIGTLP